MGSCASGKQNRCIKTKTSSSKQKFIRLVRGNLNDTYEIVEKIGDGTYGEVFLAFNKTSNSKRAIKVIKKIQSLSTDNIMEEVNILKEIDHPSIVRVFEIIHNADTINIVMELCTGGDLLAKLEKVGNFTEKIAAGYILDIASAVKYCHDAHIVHRDLKLENVLLETDDPRARLKIIDFGTSEHFQPKEKMNALMGSSYYMAPEVIDQNYNEKCDVWSLGVILFILLSGKPPFQGETDEEIFRKIKNEPLRFRGNVWTTVSDEAKALLARLLTKDPSHRPSITDVLLDPWIQNELNLRIEKNVATEHALDNMHEFSVRTT
jgi:calcium-dependent protein kinase